MPSHTHSRFTLFPPFTLNPSLDPFFPVAFPVASPLLRRITSRTASMSKSSDLFPVSLLHCQAPASPLGLISSRLLSTKDPGVTNVQGQEWKDVLMSETTLSSECCQRKEQY